MRPNERPGFTHFEGMNSSNSYTFESHKCFVNPVTVMDSLTTHMGSWVPPKPIRDLQGKPWIGSASPLAISRPPNPFLPVEGGDWIDPTMAADVY